MKPVETHKVVKPDDGIKVYQPKGSFKSSQLNGMERWNELIAGFVLGNLTPEEAESIAKILADNPQLASHIARLRNTATVRTLGKIEWSTARSQDGSEGWADTALDLPASDIDLSSKRRISSITQGQHLGDSTLANNISPTAAQRFRMEVGKKQPTPAAMSDSDIERRNPNRERGWESQNVYHITSDRLAEKAKKLPTPTFERFSLTEALLVPLFNPLWWTAIALAIAVGIDDLRVRRSLQGALEELTRIKATPQYPAQDRPSIAK